MWRWPEWLIAPLAFKGQVLQNLITCGRFPKQGRLERRAWIPPVGCCLWSCGTNQPTPAALPSAAAGRPSRRGHNQAGKGTFKGSFPWGLEQLAWHRVALASGDVHWRREDQNKGTVYLKGSRKNKSLLSWFALM